MAKYPISRELFPFNRFAPPMASHSCVRAFCNHTRNLTDDQLFRAGGFVGLNF